MDLTPFKLDIDELLDEFTQEELTTLADMKRVWAARKFSYIFEAKPTTKSAFFMQSLFAHAISHMVSDGSLSRRLGGLYCLYCLYETQPYKPCFKIYLSLGELKRLKVLVLDAKRNAVTVVSALVKRMLDRNMLLFGSVDIGGSCVSQRVDEATKLQEKHVQIACEKLLANTRIEDYLHMDLELLLAPGEYFLKNGHLKQHMYNSRGVELELEALRKMSTDYAKAKELAIQEAANKVGVGVEDIKHIAENKKQAGDMVEEIMEEWDAQKEAFYKQTGFCRGNEIVAVDGFDELEHLLSEV